MTIRNLLLTVAAAILMPSAGSASGNRQIPIPADHAWRSGTAYRADAARYDIWEKDVVTVEDARYKHLGYEAPLRTAFFLKGLKDVTLDFGGATLVLHGKFQPFLLDCCTNVCIRNVKVLHSRSPFTEGDVVEVMENGFKMRIDRKTFPYEVKDGDIVFMGDTWQNRDSPSSSFLQFFDGATRCGVELMLAAVGRHAKVDESRPWAKDTLRLEVEEEDDLLVLKGMKPCRKFKAIRPGWRAVMAHEERSLSNCMMVECRDMSLVNYRVMNGFGMGIFPFRCHNVLLDGVKFTHDRESPGFASNCADAIHAFACSGDFVIRDSVVEGMIDDALNIHSNFYTVDSAEGDRIVADTRLEPFSSTPLFLPGDRIRVYRGLTLDALDDYRIVAVRPIGKHLVEFTLDHAVPPDAKGSAIENLVTQCRIRISNCRFGKSNTHLRFQTRGEILVENCVSEQPFMLTGDMNYWFESSPCEKVTFRNVRFLTDKGRLRVQPKFLDTESSPYYHGDILFVGCTFEAEDVGSCEYARSLTFRNCGNSLGKAMRLKAVNCGEVVAPGIEVERRTLPHRTALGVTY